MTEKKNFEEEYQYVEEPGVEENSEFIEENPEITNASSDKSKEYMSKFNSIIQQPNIRRNGLIAIGALLFLLFVLRFIGGSDIDKKNSTPPPGMVPEKISVNTNPMLEQSTAQKNVIIEESNTELKQLLNAEQTMQSNLASMREQINVLSNQVNNLSSTNQALISQIADLASRLMASQQALQELLAAKKAQPVIAKSHASVKKGPVNKPVNYFIQAVIPGRAWLMSSQGSTLTVGIGSKVPGLGVVHRIDALQGRVLMSSGRVIAFSQAD